MLIGEQAMLSITCRCGAVQIEFFTQNDLFRNECCCYDCTAGLWYANKRGGPPPPAAQCVDISWLPNDFKFLRGADKVGAFMNFENADTTRFHCKECWTVLIADHPVYEKKLIVTQVASFTAYDGLKDAALMPVQSRHFVKDLGPDQLAALPVWDGDPTNVYGSVSELLMAQLPTMREAGSEGKEMNAQHLLNKIGRAFVPTNEPRLTSGPATFNQQNSDAEDDSALTS
jgi:hypothetical protein